VNGIHVMEATAAVGDRDFGGPCGSHRCEDRSAEPVAKARNLWWS
jgi:hypothetical protein